MGLRLSNLFVIFFVTIAILLIPVASLLSGSGFVVKNDIFFYMIVGIVGSLSWLAWGIRRAYTLKYKPFLGDHSEPVSVVMPIWHEHPGTFVASVDSVVSNLRPDDELICVFDQEEIDCLAVKDYYHLPGTEIIATEPGKRHALVKGIEAAKNDVVVLCDSDVIWQPDLLTEILKPFADPKIGGVGTRQLVAESKKGLMRRIAMWWLDAKLLDYMPGMSNKGVAIVLSGRTAAYRRSYILPLLDDLENEYMFGVKALSGDDGRLTALVLMAGYKTVYQSTAILTSSFPRKFRDFVKQRVRWARNSNRCYYRAIFSGWVFKKHPLLPLTIIHTQVSGFTILAPLAAVVYSIVTDSPLVFISIFIWINAARYVRGYNHLKENPGDVFLVPIVTLFLMVLFPIVKAYSLITMNKQVWLGREKKHDSYNWGVK